MTHPPTLNYESNSPRRRRFALPSDWRRRLAIGGVAAAVVFALTFLAAWRAQASAIAYFARGSDVGYVHSIQKQVDEFIRSAGKTPATLSDVPEIASGLNSSSRMGSDQWGHPYVLVNINGSPTVVSYGRDGVPGGAGLDADITAKSSYGGSPVTLGQFLEVAKLGQILLICLGAAAATGLITFFLHTDRPPARLGLIGLLARAAVTGAAAVLVGSFIAAVHAPSGH
jgi:hypothetical protein